MPDFVKRKLSCKLCGGKISESAFRSSPLKRCRKCYLLDKKLKSKGRTPNIKCADCEAPLYKQPYLFAIRKEFRCGDCHKKWQSSYNKAHPESYQKMLENSGCVKKGQRFPLSWRINMSLCQGGTGDLFRRRNVQKLRKLREYTDWCKFIYSRDEYTCQMCGEKNSYGNKIQAHHIKSFTSFPELRYEKTNGITLCKSCHYSVRHKEQEWESYFNFNLEARDVHLW